MAKTLITSIGIENDTASIRAVKINITRSGSKTKVKIIGLSELRGDFSNDDNLSAGIKKIKEKIGISPNDRVATCLSGKQVFVAQIPFRRMPEEEMKNALRLEIKKSLPFEVAGASIDYQILEASKKSDTPQCIVTAVPSVMLTRHVNMMERLGIKPWVVDVLPLAIGNAFHLSQDSLAMGLAYVVVHVGPVVTNLVVCGGDKLSTSGVPFFHRSIYFLTDDLLGENRAEGTSEEEMTGKFQDLTEEISRSISFYEKTYSIDNFAGVYLLGEYLDNEIIKNSIGKRTSLTTEIIDVFSRLKQASNAPKGKFEVAMALAMRNAK